MNKNMMKRTIETLMTEIVKRPVVVDFGHLGQDRPYTVAIQKSLYEFDPEGGPKGPMYLSLNNNLLQDTGKLTKVLASFCPDYSHGE